MRQSSGSDGIDVGAPESPDATSSGLTRREVLKRGAILGGAIAWSVPTIQAVGMRPAHAAVPSPGCTTYCMVWTPSTPSSPSHWDPYDGTGCLPCEGGTGTIAPDADTDFTVDYTTDSYFVTFPNTYTLVGAAIRHGETLSGCADNSYGPDDVEIFDDDNDRLYLLSPGPAPIGNSGYRIEFIVQIGEGC